MANRNFDFNWEFDKFKICTVHEDYKDKNSPLRKNCPVELFKYFDDKHNSGYVVAWFELDDEGYELHFIGNRPMKDISPQEMSRIWGQLQAAQKMLDAYFEACCKEEQIDDYGYCD